MIELSPYAGRFVCIPEKKACFEVDYGDQVCPGYCKVRFYVVAHLLLTCLLTSHPGDDGSPTIQSACRFVVYIVGLVLNWQVLTFFFLVRKVNLVSLLILCLPFEVYVKWLFLLPSLVSESDLLLQKNGKKDTEYSWWLKPIILANSRILISLVPVVLLYMSDYPTYPSFFHVFYCRGMNYLHEHKPEAIIHRDLEPSYVLSPPFFSCQILVKYL